MLKVFSRVPAGEQKLHPSSAEGLGCSFGPPAGGAVGSFSTKRRTGPKRDDLMRL